MNMNFGNKSCNPNGNNEQTDEGHNETGSKYTRLEV